MGLRSDCQSHEILAWTDSLCTMVWVARLPMSGLIARPMLQRGPVQYHARPPAATVLCYYSVPRSTRACSLPTTRCTNGADCYAERGSTLRSPLLFVG